MFFALIAVLSCLTAGIGSHEDEEEHVVHAAKTAFALRPARGSTQEIWLKAWQKNLKEQNLANNAVKEILNALTRIIGWITLDLVLYGGGIIFPR